MKAKLSNPLKWHGGKSYLADWIISLMPPRCKNPNAPAADDPGWLHYVEPFFGGGSVLLANDPEGISEVVNDKNSELANFWAVLRSPEMFESFYRMVVIGTPFSQDLYGASATNAAFEEMYMGCIERAWRFFIVCRQSMSGRMKNFAPLTRNRTRRGMNEQASAWLNAIEGLPAVHERLKRVVILNDDAIMVIQQQDGPRTLFYLDPPYIHETRVTTGEYAHEMTDEQHKVLLSALACIKGRFLLSGYRSEVYDDYARKCGWNCHEKEIDNKASSAKSKKKMVECVWTNY